MDAIRLDKVLTFGELGLRDKFIALPVEGDDSGHGGFKKAHYLFIKISPPYQQKLNALRLKNCTLSEMPDHMPVIKVE